MVHHNSRTHYQYNPVCNQPSLGPRTGRLTTIDIRRSIDWLIENQQFDFKVQVTYDELRVKNTPFSVPKIGYDLQKAAEFSVVMSVVCRKLSDKVR